MPHSTRGRVDSSEVMTFAWPQLQQLPPPGPLSSAEALFLPQSEGKKTYTVRRHNGSL